MDLSFIFYRVYVTRCHRVPIDRSSWIQLEWTQLQGLALLHSDPADYLQNDQVFLQSNICEQPRPDYSSRWLLGAQYQDTQSCSAVQPFHQVRQEISLLLTSWSSFTITLSCQIRNPKKICTLLLPLLKLQNIALSLPSWTPHSRSSLRTLIASGVPTRKSHSPTWNILEPTIQFFNQRTLNRNENRERENTLLHLPQRKSYICCHPSICCASHLLWPHFEGNALA